MTAIWHVLLEPVLFTLAGVLLLLMGLSVALLWRNLWKLRRLFVWAGSGLAHCLGDSQPGHEERRLAMAVRRARAGMYSGKPVLARPLQEVFADHAKESLDSSWGAWLGTIFTGLALVFTFVLIALVLFRDVGPAIRAVSGESAQVSSGLSGLSAAPGVPPGDTGSQSGEILANAVSTLGAKFLISCLGIFLTIIHQALLRTIRRRALDVAAASAEKLRLGWESMEMCTLRMQGDMLERVGSLEQTLLNEGKAGRQELTKEMLGVREEMRGGVGALKEALARLEQITVSVQDLGSEVSEKLANMMKQTIAEEVARRLSEVKQAIDAIEEKLGAFITQNAERLSQDLRAALDQIHQVLVKQPSSEVEKLLDRVKDAVTGGFSSETVNMSEMLLGFSKVLPDMSAQMQSVAGELRKVVTDLGVQQLKTNELVEGIARTSNKHIEEIGTSLAQRGGDALNQLLGTSEEHIGRMVVALQQAAEANAAKASSMATGIEQAGGSVTQVTGALGQSTEKLAAVAQNAASLIASTTQATKTMLDVAAALQRANADATGLVKQVAQGQEQAKDVLAKLAAESQRQAELLQKMQATWPILIREVTESVQQSTDKLGTSWSALADKLNTATQSYGTHVGDKVEELTEAVENLARIAPSLMKR